jgi:hypothetical protein
MQAREPPVQNIRHLEAELHREWQRKTCPFYVLTFTVQKAR